MAGGGSVISGFGENGCFIVWVFLWCSGGFRGVGAVFVV